MWYEEMTILLRHVIDDLDDPPKYTDDRLAQLLLLAGKNVNGENQFTMDYVADIVNITLTPDPTVSATRSDAFVNLTILKSACMLASSGLLKLSKENLSVKEGPYSFDGRGKLAGRKVAVDTWCKAYMDAQWEYAVLHRPEPGIAILGPFRVFLNSAYTNVDRREGCARGGLFQY